MASPLMSLLQRKLHNFRGESLKDLSHAKPSLAQVVKNLPNFRRNGTQWQRA